MSDDAHPHPNRYVFAHGKSAAEAEENNVRTLDRHGRSLIALIS